MVGLLWFLRAGENASSNLAAWAKFSPHRPMGLDTAGIYSGFVPYFVPKDVLLCARMHLTQDMVRQLIPFLVRFADRVKYLEVEIQRKKRYQQQQ